MTTLTEAIYYHGGEPRGQRDASFDLPQGNQDAVFEFLRSLVVVP